MMPGLPPLRNSAQQSYLSAALRRCATFFLDVMWCVLMSACHSALAAGIVVAAFLLTRRGNRVTAYSFVLSSTCLNLNGRRAARAHARLRQDRTLSPVP